MKAFSYLLVGLLLLTAVPFALFAQTDQIARLEKEAKNAQGQRKIQLLFELSKVQMEAKRYDDGVSALKEAAQVARKERVSSTIAQVNKRRAEYIMTYAPNLRKYNSEVLDALERSINENESTLTDQILGLLYRLENRNSDRRIDEKVGKLISGIESKQEAISLEAQRKLDEQEFKEFRKRAEGEKFEDYKTLQAERIKLDSAVEKLAVHTENLNRLNKVRQEQIDQLSEQKAASELDLEKKLRRIDSLEFVAYRDSMVNVENRRMIEGQQVEIRRRDAEIKLSKTKTTLFVVLASLVFLVSLFLFMRYRSSQKHNQTLAAKNDIIAREKEKSDRLLLNILPAKVADELKEEGKVKTQYFESATVMFADFCQFSKIASEISPEKLIEDLDYCFSKFDEIVASYGVEKIKTVGDAYMCVAGVPNPVKDHASRMIQCAQEIQAFLEIWNSSRKEDGFPEFQARIGVHSGPLIAGVVGTAKFAYDIWGETVNIADRMQDSGEPGEINISKATEQLLNGNYKLEYRGKLQIKNMADIEGFFVRL